MDYVEGREFKYEKTAITLGKFDGIHRGHQMLLKKIISQKANGLKSVMFTFSSHPQNLLQHKKTELIYTLEEKRILLEKWGLDVLISYPFNKEVAAMRAYDFVKDVLVGQLDGKMIVVGQNFRFGHKREGDTDLLEKLSKEFDFELVIVDKIEYDGKRVSSSSIKELIAKGDLEYANHLLGNPYTIVGNVLHGRKIGRTIGFPTVNLITDEIKLLPLNGVYVSNTMINDKTYKGVTSIGQNPTVGLTKEKRIETYLFDFEGDLYDESIRVQILSRIRPEVKFENIDSLKEEIEKDIIKGKAYFNLD